MTRNERIQRYLLRGKSLSWIAKKMGITMGVVAGVNYRMRHNGKKRKKKANGHALQAEPRRSRHPKEIVEQAKHFIAWRKEQQRAA